MSNCCSLAIKTKALLVTIASIVSYCSLGSQIGQARAGSLPHIDGTLAITVAALWPESRVTAGRTFIEANSVLRCDVRWKLNQPIPPQLIATFELADDTGKVIVAYPHPLPPALLTCSGGQTASYQYYLRLPQTVPTPLLNLRFRIFATDDGQGLHTFGPSSKPQRQLLIAQLFIAPVTEIFYEQGFYKPEPDGTQWQSRWMMKKANVRVRNPRRPTFLVISGRTIPRCFKESARFTLELPNRQSRPINAVAPEFELTFPVTRTEWGDSTWAPLTFEASEVFVPSFCGLGSDGRALSFMMRHIGTEDVRYGAGWYDKETDAVREWRWMADRADLLILKQWPCSLLLIDCETYPHAFTGPIKVTLHSDSGETTSVEVTSRLFRISLLLNAEDVGEAAELTISLTTDETFKPIDVGISKDTRPLSLRVNAVLQVPCAP